MKKIIICIACCLTLASCATVYLMKSRAPEAEITVDGKTEDWRGALYVLDEERIFVGFMNDQSYLYVCLVAGDSHPPAQIKSGGLTVWFDPTGGKHKTLGIRYPMKTAPDGIEILRSNNSSGELTTLEEANKMGLEVRADASGGSFIYELKIPLVATEKQLIAVGAALGTAVGIGFETGEPELGRTPEGGGGRTGGGIGGAGRGGGIGGPGGMGGGRVGNGRMPNIPTPIKFWAKVQLR